MSPFPDTRYSLLIRLQNPGDQRAWEEFVEIYRRLIFRFAQNKGLQAADAEDLTQQVLLAVGRAIEQRPHDPSRARFRTWLYRVAHNAILNALTRVKPDRGSGGSQIQPVLIREEAPQGPDSELLRLEYRREVFRWAARQVQAEFRSPTWDAFWMTEVEGKTVESVAQQLGRNPGAIYTARSRVMRRIRERASEYEPEDCDDPDTGW